MRTSLTCPYCWQTTAIEPLHPGDELAEFVTDCEVCCRPIRVTATWDAGDAEPSLEAEPES